MIHKYKIYMQLLKLISKNIIFQSQKHQNHCLRSKHVSNQQWDIICEFYEYFYIENKNKQQAYTYRKETDCQKDKKIKHEKGFA